MGVRGCGVETWMMPWRSTKFVSHYFSWVAVQKVHIVTKFATCVTVILVRSSGKTLFADIFILATIVQCTWQTIIPIFIEHQASDVSFWVSIHFALSSSSWSLLWLHRKIISTSKLRAHAPSFDCAAPVGIFLGSPCFLALENFLNLHFFLPDSLPGAAEACSMLPQPWECWGNSFPMRTVCSQRELGVCGYWFQPGVLCTGSSERHPHAS